VVHFNFYRFAENRNKPGVTSMIVLSSITLSVIWVSLNCPLREEATPGVICKIPLSWNK
jgi:hypothetical protein